MQDKEESKKQEKKVIALKKAVNENCSCCDEDCPRHGDCGACQEYHHASCSRTSCGK